MAGSGKPVPSSDIRDLEPNANTLDEVINSEAATTTARETPTNPSGKTLKTLSGIYEDTDNAIQAIRTVNAGDFDAGFTITARNEVALYPADGKQYRWIGALPKTVAAGSTPSGTGGIYPSGDWVDVGQSALRSELAQDNGTELIGGSVRTGEPLTPAGTNGKSDLLSCVIRNPDGTEFGFIDNATHTPSGFESISTSGSTVTLTYKETYPKRGSIICGPDETLQDWGLTVGASVSSSQMSLKMSAPYRARLLLDDLTITQGYMFNDSIATDIGDDGVKFEYGLQTSSQNVVAASVVGYGNNSPEFIRTIQGVDGTSKFLQILTYSRIEGLIDVVSTSDVQYTTQTAKFNSGEVVATWNATSNRIEISHPKRLNRFSFSVVERLGSGDATFNMFKADVRPSGDNITQVYFYDYSGNLIADPTGFQFWISLGYAIDKTGDVLIDLGPKRIDASKVAESLGNVWIFGNQLK